MALKSFRPITKSLRFTQLNRPEEISDKRPERSLVEHKHKTGGRNVYGRLTSRRRGGGHKKLYRIIDFKRAKLDMPARVQAIEYDPNRSALLALLAYQDGTKTSPPRAWPSATRSTAPSRPRPTTSARATASRWPSSRPPPACTASR
jgi:large subunit ribosomal protein L2